MDDIRGSEREPMLNVSKLTKIVALSVALGLAACGGKDAADSPSAHNSLNNTEFPAEAMPYHVDASQSFYSNVAGLDNSGQYPEFHDEFESLLETPVATWLGEWLGTSREDIKNHVSQVSDSAAQNHEMPVFVMYMIPYRDLGGFSSGGKSDYDEYMEWAKGVSEGIGEDNPAVVAIEPDALAGVPEMDDTEGQERIKLLRDTLALFNENNPKVIPYLDLGHDAWLTPEQAADLLKQVDDGTGLVQAISLNISSFGSTKEVSDYAGEISDLFGRQLRVIVDTGLNGAIPEPDRSDWCNNRNLRVGKAEDTAFDPDDPIEEITIKPPGESGGECGKDDPEAGEFDKDLLFTQLGHPSGRYTR